MRPDEAIKECQRAETIIYAISTNWTPSRGKGDQILTQMAEATGGQVFFPPSVEEMSNSFRDIEEELRSQYALTYTPADFKYDGAFPHNLSLLQRPPLSGTRQKRLFRAPSIRPVRPQKNRRPGSMPAPILSYLFLEKLVIGASSILGLVPERLS